MRSQDAAVRLRHQRAKGTASFDETVKLRDVEPVTAVSVVNANQLRAYRMLHRVVKSRRRVGKVGNRAALPVGECNPNLIHGACVPVLIGIDIGVTPG